jgi:hypothetical protein
MVVVTVVVTVSVVVRTTVQRQRLLGVKRRSGSRLAAVRALIILL